MRAQHILSLDVDWAADWMIADVAESLVRSGVRATWFVTHRSPLLTELLSEPLFEVGIHPNFLPGSSHGREPAEVVGHMKELVPTARIARTHSLFQSERHSQIMVEDFGIYTDCSVLLLDSANITPHRVRYTAEGPWLTRVPHVFQDNMFMYTSRPWRFDDPIFHTSGLKVFDFHPIHLALNSQSMSAYDRIKSLGRPPSALTRDDVAEARFPGAGCFTLFAELLDSLRGRSQTITDYVEQWRAHS